MMSAMFNAPAVMTALGSRPGMSRRSKFLKELTKDVCAATSKIEPPRFWLKAKMDVDIGISGAGNKV